MQREIKFRAWDAGNKCMIHFDDFWVSQEYRSICFRAVLSDLTEKGKDLPGAYGTGANPESKGAYILMQFTGLHDKNGKEIYEGDVINDGLHSNIVIGWCKELASFVLTRKGWAFRHWFGESCDPEKVEVIGSIYENPELIA